MTHFLLVSLLPMSELLLWSGHIRWCWAAAVATEVLRLLPPQRPLLRSMTPTRLVRTGLIWTRWTAAGSSRYSPVFAAQTSGDPHFCFVLF